MSNSLTIYINRGEFVWESDIWRGSDKIGSCTGPTLAGCMDTAYEIIAEHDPEWASFDSNEDSRKRHMYQAKHSKNAEIVEAPVVMSNKMTHDEDCKDEICNCNILIALSRPVKPHDELLARMNQRYWKMFNHNFQDQTKAGIEHRQLIQKQYFALRAVVELHKQTPENRYPENLCQGCSMTEEGLYIYYPCQTIQAIEKELGEN